MRLFALILASFFAFGMPEVRAQESLEESVEVVISHSQNQSAPSKRVVRSLAITCQMPTAQKASRFLRVFFTGPATSSLFLEHRVLRL
jgi:hypothetical protein